MAVVAVSVLSAVAAATATADVGALSEENVETKEERKFEAGSKGPIGGRLNLARRDWAENWVGGGLGGLAWAYWCQPDKMKGRGDLWDDAEELLEEGV